MPLGPNTGLPEVLVARHLAHRCLALEMATSLSANNCYCDNMEKFVDGRVSFHGGL
jgi:hypothetical protein